MKFKIRKTEFKITFGDKIDIFAGIISALLSIGIISSIMLVFGINELWFLFIGLPFIPILLYKIETILRGVFSTKVK